MCFVANGVQNLASFTADCEVKGSISTRAQVGQPNQSPLSVEAPWNSQLLTFCGRQIVTTLLWRWSRQSSVATERSWALLAHWKTAENPVTPLRPSHTMGLPLPFIIQCKERLLDFVKKKKNFQFDGWSDCDWSMAEAWDMFMSCFLCHCSQ